ncbi:MULTISPECIES: hypothetical protein [unclassified Mycobacterium]|uniref:hypothetical protein n=1 Tax=unclassified Mycobacterium TaxID=2642494 RepID=UPI0029C91319|nr:MULTISPECIES: hypothetical protein [unclassified Mycobacterium]
MSSAAATILLSAGLLLAPAGHADPAPNVQDAAASLRGGSSCAPLHYDPVVEQAAATITRVNAGYVNHTGTTEPVADALPGLKDLGYRGNKATILQGAAPDHGDSVKAMLLEGYAALRDCSYTDFGVDVRSDDSIGITYSVLVLAGP